MSKKKYNKKYTNEFKEEAVKIAMSSDQPYSVTAKELGINPRTFYNLTSGSMVDSVTTSNQNKKNTNTKLLELEIKELKKKLRRTEIERDILKKAALNSSSQCNILNLINFNIDSECYAAFLVCQRVDIMIGLDNQLAREKNEYRN